MLPKALIFDVDGTLADTERDGHRIAFNRAFKDAGLDWNWTVELYGDLLAVTGGKERMNYFLENFNREFSKPKDYSVFLQSLHQAKNRHYADMLASGQIKFRPGVDRLLREAKEKNIRLAVATTTSPENVEALLKYAGSEPVTDWFEVIAAGDIVPAKKPAPDIYWYALEKLRLEPSQCMAFEDSENGLRASLGAKLQTIITINEYTRDQNFTGASLVVDQLGEPGESCKVLAGEMSNFSMINLESIAKIYQR